MAKSLNIISREYVKKGSKWIPSDHSVVCSLHFISEDFKENCKRRILKAGSVPSVFPEYPSYMQKSTKRRRRDSSSASIDDTHPSNFIVRNGSAFSFF